MSSGQSDSTILDQLQSAEQHELMNAINLLRGQQLTKDLALPQLIVRGNQSSGKSSVVETIARVSFPSGDGTTTRFASDLILQRGDDTGRAASVVPSANASDEEKDHLLLYQPKFTAAEDFADVL